MPSSAHSPTPPPPLSHTYQWDFIVKILAGWSLSGCLISNLYSCFKSDSDSSDLYLVSRSLGVSITMYFGKAGPRLLAILTCRKVNRIREVGRWEAGELAEQEHFPVSTGGWMQGLVDAGQALIAKLCPSPLFSTFILRQGLNMLPRP